MPTAQKQETVAEIKRLFDEADSFFVTDYQGLNVEDITQLRTKLRKNRVKFLVEKNTLIRIAANEAGAPNLDKYLKGPTAIAFAMGDPSAAAKVLNDHYKEKQLPRIKVFVVEDHVHPASDIGRLADLPSREMLLSAVVGSVEAPLTQLVGSIDGFFRQLVGSIDALSEKRKSEAA